MEKGMNYVVVPAKMLQRTNLRTNVYSGGINRDETEHARSSSINSLRIRCIFSVLITKCKSEANGVWNI